MDALDTILRTGAAYQAEFQPILDEYCIALDLDGCFDGLSASEANQTAMDIVVAVCGRDDPADYLHQRADQMVASALAISRSLAYRCIGLVMAHLPVGRVTCEPGSDPVYLRPMRDIETIDSELRLLFPRVAGSGRPHRNRDHDQGAPGSRFMTTEG